MKELIIVRGRNVPPQDIEDAVAGVTRRDPRRPRRRGRAHARDRAAARDRRRDRARALADVRSRSGRGRHPQAVHAEFGLGVAGVTLLRPGGMPKTTSGKLKRLECRRRLETGARRRRDRVARAARMARCLRRRRRPDGAVCGRAVRGHARPRRRSPASIDRRRPTPCWTGCARGSRRCSSAAPTMWRRRAVRALRARLGRRGHAHRRAGRVAARWSSIRRSSGSIAHPLALAEHLAGLVAERAGAGDPVELA